MTFSRNSKKRKSGGPKHLAEYRAHYSGAQKGDQNADQTYGGARDLVWLDMEPLLSEQRQKCEQASDELSGLLQVLEVFRSQWQPAYLQWFHGKFGESVTRARELAAKADELRHLITDVEMESFATGCSEKKAYDRLERIRKGAEKIDELRAGRFKDQGNEATEDISPGCERELPPEVEEFLKMGFEQMFGGRGLSPEEYSRMFAGFKQDFREEVLGEKRASDESERRGKEKEQKRRGKRPSAPKKISGAEASEDLRRKRIYRELARKLHPDLNGSLGERETELWHEVRAAYEAKNTEQLETLWAMVDGEGKVGFEHVRSVSRLLAIVAETRKKIKAAQKSLREAKKEPAWNFSAMAKDSSYLNALARQIDRDLKEDIAGLSEEIEYAEGRIAKWSRPPTARKKRASRPDSSLK